MSRSKGTRPSRGPQSDPAAPGRESGAVPGATADNGSGEEEAETGTALATEEPAQVQLTIKGSDKSARAAAKRFGEGAAQKLPPVQTSPSDPEAAAGKPADPDPIATLLADGKNMVIVTRQTPRNIRGPRGDKIITNVRLPGKYTCPTSIAAIEEQVFEEHWGSTYKCTIHPDTSSGENTILGHFKIEHPDPKAPPYVEGVTDVEPEQNDPATERLLSGKDPTMQETDTLVEIREQLKRQLDRANTRKEIAETQKVIKQINEELDGRNEKPAVTAENEEIRKLRERIAEQDRQLSEKKVNDRFDRIETLVADLAKAITTKPAAAGEESVAMQMLKMSQQHSKDMMALIQEKTKPAASAEDSLDKFLDRAAKLQQITGSGNKGGGRHSEIEDRLIDLAWENLKGGRGTDESSDESDPYEDVLKTALKEFAPIAKTFVEKKMNQEAAASGGAPIPPEVMNRIYAEAGTAAAKKVQEDLLTQGIKLVADEHGKLLALPAPKAGGKSIVPPRQPASRVVSTTKTSEGVVKKILVERADLSQKSSPRADAAPAEAHETPLKGESVPKQGIFPMIGPNGTELQIPFPARPGDMKYDRKYSVNFILDGIRSEIRQGYPQKAAVDGKVECYVVGDSVDFLDDEILDRILDIDSGPALETLLTPWGAPEKIVEIKKLAEDEVVASYLRRLVQSIQREWAIEKSKK